MTVYKCDRCNKETPEDQIVTVYMKPAASHQTRYDAMFDLCEECAKKLDDWLGEEVEGD